ncbi:hypothetical protein BV378_22250 [Nostoc sp. RF31YmG]|nr:hypothetical protein BV378_22250 [Nostoc sp. RF31YmG]
MIIFIKIKSLVSARGVGVLWLLIALITGCSSSPSITKQEPAEPAIANSSTPSVTPAVHSSPQVSATADSSRCRTNQLSVSRVGSDAGAGNVALIYSFTNKGTSSCTLYGYPGLALLDAKDQPLGGIKVIRAKDTYFQNKQPPQQVTLATGEQASFQITYNHIRSEGKSCPTSAKIEITPPNAYEHLTIPEQIDACTRQVKVTPVRAGVTQR